MTSRPPPRHAAVVARAEMEARVPATRKRKAPDAPAPVVPPPPLRQKKPLPKQASSRRPARPPARITVIISDDDSEGSSTTNREKKDKALPEEGKGRRRAAARANDRILGTLLKEAESFSESSSSTSEPESNPNIIPAKVIEQLKQGVAHMRHRLQELAKDDPELSTDEETTPPPHSGRSQESEEEDARIAAELKESEAQRKEQSAFNKKWKQWSIWWNYRGRPTLPRVNRYRRKKQKPE